MPQSEESVRVFYMDALRVGAILMCRLMIPTLAWTFLLVAPQIYFERLLQGVELSYVQFYKTFLEFKWYPEGNFHWLHLWFLPYLFVYNVVLIPIYKMLGRIEGNRRVRWGPLLGLYIGFAVVPYTFLSVRYPVSYDFIHDVARHSLFIFFVVFGILVFRFSSLSDFIEKHRAVFLRCGLASLIIINIVRWNGWEPKYLWEDWLTNPLSYLFFAVLNVNSWFWVIAIVGYAKRYLNQGGTALTYCNQAAFPFYILHQSVIVLVAYYVVQTGDNAAFKYLFLLLACFALSALFYHLYIRPFKSVRFLFGSK